MNVQSPQSLSADRGEAYFGTHKVVKGDTLIGIMKSEIPLIEALKGTPGVDTKITHFLKTLSPEDMKRIGITSDNINLIRTGKDTINLDVLHELVNERMGDVSVPVEAVPEQLTQPGGPEITATEHTALEADHKEIGKFLP